MKRTVNGVTIVIEKAKFDTNEIKGKFFHTIYSMRNLRTHVISSTEKNMYYRFLKGLPDDKETTDD